MLDISERNYSILKRIVSKKNNSPNYTKLSQELNVSEKTLRNDIRILNTKLNEFDGKIIEKDNVLVLVSPKPLIDWLNLLKEKQKISEIDLIKLTILIQTESITIGDLATNLYLSKSKLEKILPSISFDGLEIIKIRNLGILVSGPTIIKYNHFINIIYKYIDDLTYIDTSLNAFDQVFKKSLSLLEYQTLISSHNQYLLAHPKSTDQQTKVHFLCLILNAFFINDKNTYQKYMDTFFTNPTINYTLEIQNIIDAILLENYIVYNSSSTTYRFLINHLNTILNQPLFSQNSFDLLLVIKRRFPFSYSIALVIFNKLQLQFNINIPEVQLDYITIYIQTLINEKISEQKLGVVIITQYGSSIAQYLRDKFEEQFSKQITITVWTLRQFQNEKILKNQIIISTIENINNPYALFISPIPTDQEISDLTQQIISKFIQFKIDNLLQSEFIFELNTNFIDQTLERIGQTLINNELVTTDFLVSFKKRLDFPFAIANSGLVLHGNPEEVLENQLLIFRLNNSISLNNEPIQLIFVLLLTKDYLDSNREITKEIYNILQNKNIIELLLTASSLSFLKYTLKNNTIIKQKFD